MRRILIIAVLAGIIPPFIFSQTTGPDAHATTAGARATEQNGQNNRQNNYPGKTWEKAKSPEELGWLSEGLTVKVLVLARVSLAKSLLQATSRPFEVGRIS